MFSTVGIISYGAETNEDALMEAAIEAGADDVVTNEDNSKDVMTTLENYLNVKEALVAAGFEPESSEITMQAATKAELDKENAEKMMLLIDRLEDLDDVQNVYSNGDISDEIMATMG
jgi:transcriptional/translational regulatory protein YebC/TACO1